MERVPHWQFLAARIFGKRREFPIDGQNFVGFRFGKGFYFCWAGAAYRGETQY